MTPDEFTLLLDRYGADFSRWPLAEREAAQSLLRQGPGEAWRLYRVAQTLEAELALPGPVPDRALFDRILLASQQVTVAETVSPWRLFAGWQRGLAGAAICACFMAGLFSGWSEQAEVSVFSESDIPGLTYSPGEMENWP